MKFIRVDGAARVFRAPEGMEDVCGDLEVADVPDPVWRNRMVCAALPSPEDIERLIAGEPLMLSIVGPEAGHPDASHPVVSLYVGERVAPDIEMAKAI